MSSLSQQASSFRTQLSSHLTVAAPSRTTAANDVAEPTLPPPPAKKAKIGNAPGKIYSQPNETGTGRHWQTKVVYLANFLKENGPTRLDDLAIKLSMDTLLHAESALFAAFKSHDKVVHDPRTNLYSYKPDYVIKSAADLHTIIAQHHPRGGMPIRLLRESWPLVGPAIEELEREGKVMVTRTGNGNVGGGAGGHGQGGAGEGGTMKTVFLDPIGKIAGLDQEFKDMWDGLTTPAADDLGEELKNAGLATASTISLPPTLAKKKKGGKGLGSHNRKLKITNTHLKSSGIDLTKDFVPARK